MGEERLEEMEQSVAKALYDVLPMSHPDKRWRWESKKSGTRSAMSESWDALDSLHTATFRHRARAVLEAAGVPALLERVEALEQQRDRAMSEANQWTQIYSADAAGALARDLKAVLERAEFAEARVAQLEDDVNRLGDAFARLYLQALNGVVCDPTGEPGTRGCCRECHNAWASGKAVLDKHDPGWGGLQRAHVFRVGEPQVGRDRHSTQEESATPDPSENRKT
jgi:hypothetical protein